jgi:hypothetical protein
MNGLWIPEEHNSETQHLPTGCGPNNKLGKTLQNDTAWKWVELVEIEKKCWA